MRGSEENLGRREGIGRERPQTRTRLSRLMASRQEERRRRAALPLTKEGSLRRAKPAALDGSARLRAIPSP